MASITQTLISVGGLFVGFSSDIQCNLLQKSDLKLERVFSSCLHVKYGLLVTGRFKIIPKSSLLFPKRHNINPYDSFLSLVVLF